MCKNKDKNNNLEKKNENDKYMSRECKLLRGKFLEIYKANLVLSKFQREVLIGTLLGDATMPKQKNKTSYNIKFEQSIKNEEYINHLYDLFKY